MGLSVIETIGHLRDLPRYRQILATLVRYGYQDVVSALQLEEWVRPASPRPGDGPAVHPCLQERNVARFSSPWPRPSSARNWLGSTFDRTACRTYENTRLAVARVVAT